MDMNTMTLPRKGLKTRPYSMDMEDHIVTLPKRGLKTRPYSMDMNKDIATLPKKGLKTRPYNIGMEKKGLKKYDYNIDMEKKVLKKLTKGQLIKLLLKKVHNHEHLLDNDPFKDEVAQEPAKRIKPPKTTRKPPPPPIPQVEDHIINVPVPKIKELNQALKGHAKSYGIELQDNLNPLNHFTKTRALVESHLENLLKDMKGFKFIETLEVTFEKDTIDSKTGKRVSIYKTAFFNGKAKTIAKANNIEHELSMSRQEILNVIDKWVSEGSGWVIDQIDSHYINVTTYTPLHGSSYIELPVELKNPKKRLINIRNKDDECFRWCHIRHLNPQEKNPQRIKKVDKKMINEMNYDGIDFPLSQKHYNKVEKQNSIRINVFGYENGQPFPIHISKEIFEDQMNLLLITKDEKKHYVLIKDFNAFMYNQSKHKERKHFCMYCLQCFSSERILANHVNNCLTINGAQAINIPKQGENVLKFNNFHKQLPVPFVIYADFEAITKKVQGCKQSEEMENEKNKRSYMEAYQTQEDCGYRYKLVCCYRERDIVSQSKHIEMKTPFTNLWTRCSKRLNTAKLLLRNVSTNHWL